MIKILRLMALLSMLLLTTSVLATPRTALVIGNGGYRNAPLNNPPADARAMAEKLRALDFQVIEMIDVNRTEMRTAIRDFSQLLRTHGGVGLFFYAGHGVQVEGNNYLLPVGVDIQRAFEVPDEALEMNAVLRAMEHAGNDMNVVILDACRNNPFARSFRSAEQGLARMEGPTGSLIAYSTAPGSVAADGDGGNSPYTSRLLEAMDTPGLSLEQVFKQVREGVVAATDGSQVPWEHSSLLGEFYFRPPTDPAHSNIDDIVDDTVDQALDVELSFWESIKDSDDPAYFRAYLEQYPTGHFASLATLRLEALEPTATAPPQPDPRIEIERIVRSAKAGDAKAQGQLGQLLATGQGVPQDLQWAYIWTSLAAERGIEAAEPTREQLIRRLDKKARREADKQLKALLARYLGDKDHDKKSKKPKKKKKDKDDEDD